MKKNLVMLSAAILVLWMSGCAPTQKVKINMTNEHNQSKPDVITIPEPGPDVIISPDVDPEIETEQLSTLMQKVQIIHFAYNSYTLDDENYAKVLENTKLIKKVLKNQNLNFKVSGHCDEWGSDEYNHALGLQRAKAVMEVMVEKGISSDSLNPFTYGELSPVCTERTKSCDAKNRRVEFQMISTIDKHF